MAQRDVPVCHHPGDRGQPAWHSSRGQPWVQAGSWAGFWQPEGRGVLLAVPVGIPLGAGHPPESCQHRPDCTWPPTPTLLCRRHTSSDIPYSWGRPRILGGPREPGPAPGARPGPIPPGPGQPCQGPAALGGPCILLTPAPNPPSSFKAAPPSPQSPPCPLRASPPSPGAAPRALPAPRRPRPRPRSAGSRRAGRQRPAAAGPGTAPAAPPAPSLPRPASGRLPRHREAAPGGASAGPRRALRGRGRRSERPLPGPAPGPQRCPGGGAGLRRGRGRPGGGAGRPRGFWLRGGGFEAMPARRLREPRVLRPEGHRLEAGC